MQIVIDIPEEMKQAIENGSFSAKYNIYDLCGLVMNSTLLPEGHGWIPVSEREPEEYGEYLITWTTSQSKRPFIAICEGEVTGEYDHEKNRFKLEWLLDDYIKNYPDVKVTAWMPLPEPYKEGD